MSTTGAPATPEWVTANAKGGHRFESDPPFGLTSVCRFTCVTCGDAVLNCQGNVYGGATERTCVESQEFWAWRPSGATRAPEASA